MELNSRFRVYRQDNTIVFAGEDDVNDPFYITMDRVWAGNLVQELEEWLSGSAPQGIPNVPEVQAESGREVLQTAWPSVRYMPSLARTAHG